MMVGTERHPAKGAAVRKPWRQETTTRVIAKLVFHRHPLVDNYQEARDALIGSARHTLSRAVKTADAGFVLEQCIET